MMIQQIRRRDWLFLCMCLGLGILAEVSFLHGKIGVSYLIFIAGFYLVIFLRFRLSFNHRRIGLLFTVAIWLLSGSYLLYDNDFFNSVNLVVIPMLVLSHIVLITSPNTFKWETPKFIFLLIKKLQLARRYLLSFIGYTFKRFLKTQNEQTNKLMKKIYKGLAIGLPLLFIITGLLISADEIFQDIILYIPKYIFQDLLLEKIFRIGFIIVVGLLFFSIFQILLLRSEEIDETIKKKGSSFHFDEITAITVLLLINAIYVVFVIVQFKYFFSGVLPSDLTYAAYARKGFAELLFVILMNWTLLISFLKLVDSDRRQIKLTLNILYSLLIGLSGIILISAYQRLSMYEAAYGFTLSRLLAHAFMIFLMFIFAYTFIRVWIERLSMTHFYLIIGIIFYTSLNVIHVDQLIVDKNLERYKQTGKIDIDYLSSLSYTGWDGLIQLYQWDPTYPELAQMLFIKQEEMKKGSVSSWQSFNFAKQKVEKKLIKQEIKEGIQ